MQADMLLYHVERGGMKTETVKFSWYDADKTICLCELNGKWTWDEYFEERERFRRNEMTHQPERVDIILIVDRGASIPPSFLTVLKSTLKNASKNWFMTVVVNPSYYVRTLFKVFTESFEEARGRYVVVQTTEEAADLIRKNRETTRQNSNPEP